MTGAGEHAAPHTAEQRPSRGPPPPPPCSLLPTGTGRGLVARGSFDSLAQYFALCVALHVRYTKAMMVDASAARAATELQLELQQSCNRAVW